MLLRMKDYGYGPCYDFCGCSYCWNGWKTLSFWERVKLRLQYVWHFNVLGSKP